MSARRCTARRGRGGVRVPHPQPGAAGALRVRPAGLGGRHQPAADRRLRRRASSSGSTTTRGCSADPLFWRSAVNTVLFTAARHAGRRWRSGLAMAVLLNSVLPARGVFRSMLILPMAISGVATALIGLVDLRREQRGARQVAARRSACPRSPGSPAGRPAFASVVLVTLWWRVGFNMLIYLAGLQGISPGAVRGGRLDGAGRLAAVPLPHRAAGRAVVVLPADHERHLLVPGVRHRLRADRRGSAERHLGAGHLRLRQRASSPGTRGTPPPSGWCCCCSPWPSPPCSGGPAGPGISSNEAAIGSAAGLMVRIVARGRRRRGRSSSRSTGWWSWPSPRRAELLGGELRLWPRTLTLDNFRRVLRVVPGADLVRQLGGHLARRVALITVMVNLLAGYAFAHLRFRGVERAVPAGAGHPDAAGPGDHGRAVPAGHRPRSVRQLLGGHPADRRLGVRHLPGPAVHPGDPAGPDRGGADRRGRATPGASPGSCCRCRSRCWRCCSS